MIYEYIEWAGTILFIISYVLLSLRKLYAGQFIYQAMNALGGMCLVINAIHLQDKPNLVVNFLWICISVYAICSRNRKATV